MLKLIQIENSNLFGIVETIPCYSLMGYTRIAEEPAFDCTRTFEKKDDMWYEEVANLREVERDKLYKTVGNHMIRTESLIINMLKLIGSNHVEKELVVELFNYILRRLSEKKQIEDYLVYYDMDYDKEKGAPTYCSKVFALYDYDNNIYLIQGQNIEDLTKNNPLDKSVIVVIKEFLINKGMTLVS